MPCRKRVVARGRVRVRPARHINAPKPGDRVLVITVDGPAAAGKSTVARCLARRLGFQYLDTGAMYRAVTWKAIQSRVDVNDADALAALARGTCIEIAETPQGQRVLCDGRDVTRDIRTPEVTQAIYRLADEPAVRGALIEQQRAYASRSDLVVEGRDQGTDVFPGAQVKFYLDASVDERAARRLKDLTAGGQHADPDEVKRQLVERDAKDRARPMGALRKQDDMVLIDSTNLTVDQVVDRMVEEVRRRGLQPDGP